MKTYLSLFVAAAVLSIYFFGCQSPNEPASSDTLEKKVKVKCATIQQGEIYDSQGNLVETGYDAWGYNYQAHLFNGYFANASRPAVPVEEGDKLVMKWNDAWLSNKDCGTQPEQAEFTDLFTPDGKLDRHYPTDSYIGSGAWLTNHQSGTYEDNGNTCHWTYFIKIVAAPADAYVDAGIWYNADGIEIGPVIWGAFAIIQEVENDPCAGIHGLQYKSPDHPGLGNW